MIHKEVKRVLVAPLDWGAGHATRCIPVIRELIAQNVTPVLAGSKTVLARFNAEFPNLEQVHLPDQHIKYSKILPAWLAILLQTRNIVRVIEKEHQHLKTILIENKIDALISDNRYGLSGSGVPSVIITHQLNLQIPFLLKPFGFVTQNFIDKKLSAFDEIWIPDVNRKPNLSGKLSEIKQHKNVQYIGPLSRFKTALSTEQIRYDLAIILSGPAPQPEIMLQKILVNLPTSVTQIAVLSSIKYAVLESRNNFNIHWLTNASDTEFSNCLSASTFIIARSGYSTLMDLVRLNRNALLIPTPGQTEQIYLARHFQDHFGFVALHQSKITRHNIASKINDLKLKNRQTFPNQENNLKEVLQNFLKY